MKTEPQLPSATPETSRSTPAPRALDSATLLGGHSEIEISHEGETYRLRRTRQGKLILTK